MSIWVNMVIFPISFLLLKLFEIFCLRFYSPVRLRRRMTSAGKVFQSRDDEWNRNSGRKLRFFPKEKRTWWERTRLDFGSTWYVSLILVWLLTCTEKTSLSNWKCLLEKIVSIWSVSGPRTGKILHSDLNLFWKRCSRSGEKTTSYHNFSKGEGSD